MQYLSDSCHEVRESQGIQIELTDGNPAFVCLLLLVLKETYISIFYRYEKYFRSDVHFCSTLGTLYNLHVHMSLCRY